MSLEAKHLFQAISHGFLAGYVNTLGYVALFGFFTALVTGNFILTGASLVSESSSKVLMKLSIFPAFILCIAAIWIPMIWLDHEQQQHLPIQLTVSLQLSMLIAFMVIGLFEAPFDEEPTSVAAICVMLGKEHYCNTDREQS
jgi:uncharacterized membrane protein YoaK (UPF0700 family)